MTVSDDTYVRDLIQLRNRQLEVLAEIDEIQARFGRLPHEIERIQSDALAVFHDIDEICKRVEAET